MEPIEISRDEFHFVTVTDEGLEIVSEPNGEKTVIRDIRAMYSLMSEVQNWLMYHQCKSQLMEPDGQRHIWCELPNGHIEMHYGRRFDRTLTSVMGHCYWAEGENGGMS